MVTGSSSIATNANDYADDTYYWENSQKEDNRECYGVGGVDEDDVESTFTRKWAAATKTIESDLNNSSFRSLVTPKEVRENTAVISAESTFTIIGALLEPTGAMRGSTKRKTAEPEKVEGDVVEEKRVTKKKKHHHKEADRDEEANESTKVEKKHKKHRKLSH